MSVIVPALNAGARIGAAAARLAGFGEVVVADGGSADGTREAARAAGALVIEAPRGRGAQIAAGVALARLPWLLLLHADTRLDDAAAPAMAAHMAAGPARAGYFRFQLDSADPRARRLERAVAWRCRTLALPYGDQGLLIHRDLLRAAGGVRPLPLMEDVDLVRRLGRRRLAALPAAAVTSAERWERDGWNRRSARNLLCLSLYLAGLPPRIISRLYG